MRTVGWTSALLAHVAKLCTAVLTISGIRVAIGLSALAAASGIYAPAKGWHQDAIRIPMLAVATMGAVVNLAVLRGFDTSQSPSRPMATPRTKPQGKAI